MNEFIEKAKLIKDDIISYRRTIHSNPEVGPNLPKTKAYVMDKLKELGYDPKEICESGIVATIEGRKLGKTFLLRADMDALPMAEATECDFKSTNGCMHSCGHDMHTAMLLGAARLLKENQDEIEGTIGSLNKEIGEFIFDRMNDIVISTAKMFRGEAELIELSSVPPLANDTDLAKEITSYIKDLLGEKSVHLFEGGGMGSEDFASYSYEVPSVYLMLGAGTKQENTLYGEPMHNKNIVINEDTLITEAAMHTYCAIMWLKNNK
jgi:metal-dependent amidase/aminoacylase/carboxypeptidase family protein